MVDRFPRLFSVDLFTWCALLLTLPIIFRSLLSPAIRLRLFASSFESNKSTWNQNKWTKWIEILFYSFHFHFFFFFFSGHAFRLQKLWSRFQTVQSFPFSKSARKTKECARDLCWLHVFFRLCRSALFHLHQLQDEDCKVVDAQIKLILIRYQSICFDKIKCTRQN